MFKRFRKRKGRADDDDNDDDSSQAAHKSGKKDRSANPGDPKDEELSDPYDLVERFVMNQEDCFPQALTEIKQGRKRTHWLWFILPTPPYIVNGQERGSETNRHFALRDDAASAYLEMESLRSNYVEICKAMECQLKFGNSIGNIFGPFDTPKVISSLKLFQKTAIEVKDDEVATLCSSLLSMEAKKSPKAMNPSHVIGS